jgi:hypothetical protein
MNKIQRCSYLMRCTSGSEESLTIHTNYAINNVVATLQDSTPLTSHTTINMILSLFNPPLCLTSYIIMSSSLPSWTHCKSPAHSTPVHIPFGSHLRYMPCSWQFLALTILIMLFVLHKSKGYSYFTPQLLTALFLGPNNPFSRICNLWQGHKIPE